MPVHRLFEHREPPEARGAWSAPGEPVAGRAATLSAGIVAEVRAGVVDGRLKPGDFLGTEKELAARAGVSRIVARDALKTLEALGIVDIKVGARGGARIARGNPRFFAEALAVQLDLAGVSVREILDAQRAVEGLAAELAAEAASAADIARLRALVDEAAASQSDGEAFTRLGYRFHAAIAEASGNRVVVAQLASLQRVAWPSRNRTLTAPVTRHIVEVHRAIIDLIAARDGAAARRLMDDHVKMIRARRLAEQAPDATEAGAASADGAA